MLCRTAMLGGYVDVTQKWIIDVTVLCTTTNVFNHIGELVINSDSTVYSGTRNE